MSIVWDYLTWRWQVGLKNIVFPWFSFQINSFFDRAYWIVSRCMMRRQLLRMSRNINSKKKIVWYCKSPQIAVSAKQWDVMEVMGAWWLGGHVLYIDIGHNLTRQHLYFSPVQTTGVYKYILKLISFQSGRRILASLLGYQSTLIVCFCFYFVLVKVCMQQFHILIGVVCFSTLMGSFYMGCIWHWTDGISLKDKRWFSLSSASEIKGIRLEDTPLPHLRHPNRELVALLWLLSL